MRVALASSTRSKKAHSHTNTVMLPVQCTVAPRNASAVFQPSFSRRLYGMSGMLSFAIVACRNTQYVVHVCGQSHSSQRVRNLCV